MHDLRFVIDGEVTQIDHLVLGRAGHVYLLHPKAIIQRPPAKSFDTSNIIKADQFPSWYQSFVKKRAAAWCFGAH